MAVAPGRQCVYVHDMPWSMYLCYVNVLLRFQKPKLDFSPFVLHSKKKK